MLFGFFHQVVTITAKQQAHDSPYRAGKMVPQKLAVGMVFGNKADFGTTAAKWRSVRKGAIREVKDLYAFQVQAIKPDQHHTGSDARQVHRRWQQADLDLEEGFSASSVEHNDDLGEANSATCQRHVETCGVGRQIVSHSFS